MFILDGRLRELKVEEPYFSRLPESERFYCTGKPCKRGHIANRYKSNNECVECRAEKNKNLKEKQNKWAIENKERVNAVTRWRYYNNVEAQRERTRNKYLFNREKVIETNNAWRTKNPKAATHYAAKHRASKRQRTPSWADIKAIKEFYAKCPEGYHVDHIIPLVGKTVSGLHVLNNLQYLPASENQKKFNRLESKYVYS